MGDLSDKILVTGGSGQVGKHLQKIMPEAIYISSKEYDLRKQSDVVHLLEKYRPITVIHLAGKVGGIIDNIKYPAEYFYDNVLMNTMLVEQCRCYSVDRFIGILSTCIYPDQLDESQYPMEETMLHLGPPTPTNFSYGYAKRCMAVHIDSINKQYFEGKKQYQYLIPPNLFGPYDKYNERSHYVGALLQKIQKAKETGQSEIFLMGDGTPLRQFIFAEDLARIIKMCIDRDIRESFNVASGNVLSIKEIAEVVLDACDANEISFKWSGENSGQYRKDVSGKKLHQLFPDFCFTPLKDGITKTWDYINKHNLSDK